MSQSAEQSTIHDIDLGRKADLDAAIGNVAASVSANLKPAPAANPLTVARRPDSQAEAAQPVQDLEAQARGLLADVYAEEEPADAA